MTRERLSTLALYLPLGMAQLSLTTASVCAAILFGVPAALAHVLPLDADLIDIHSPAEGACLSNPFLNVAFSFFSGLTQHVLSVSSKPSALTTGR